MSSLNITNPISVTSNSQYPIDTKKKRKFEETLEATEKVQNSLKGPRKASKRTISWEQDPSFWMSRAIIPSGTGSKPWTHILSDIKRGVKVEKYNSSDRKTIQKGIKKIDKLLAEQMLPDFLEVKDCKTIKSLGVYAKKRIVKGEIIGLYAGHIVHDDGYRTSEDLLKERSSYLFSLAKNKNNKSFHYVDIDAENCGNYTRFFNNASDDNANAESIIVSLTKEEIPQIVIISKKTIQMGEQILLNYGDGYFKQKNMTPVDLTSSD